jgi:1,4-dihydroxy-2-naphthoate octaprenyltransferase
LHNNIQETGKRGVAVNAGPKVTGFLYVIVQLILITNVVVLALMFVDNGWPLLLSLVPYVLLFPKVAGIVLKNHEDPDGLKPAAGINVQIHLGFSILFLVGWGILLAL